MILGQKRGGLRGGFRMLRGERRVSQGDEGNGE